MTANEWASDAIKHLKAVESAAKTVAPSVSAGQTSAPGVATIQITPEMVGMALIQLLRGTTSLAVQIAVLSNNLAQKNPQRAA